MKKALFAGAGCLVLAAAVWWMNRTEPAQPAPGHGGVEAQPVGEDPVAPVPAPAPVPPPAGAAAGPMLAMPDGSKVAPLNDVTKPAPIVWGQYPWSPIVRTERNGGLDWYVHADGTYTTTMMLWRSDLGRKDAMTLCLHPTDPVPAGINLQRGQ